MSKNTTALSCKAGRQGPAAAAASASASAGGRRATEARAWAGRGEQRRRRRTGFGGRLKHMHGGGWKSRSSRDKEDGPGWARPAGGCSTPAAWPSPPHPQACCLPRPWLLACCLAGLLLILPGWWGAPARREENGRRGAVLGVGGSGGDGPIAHSAHRRLPAHACRPTSTSAGAGGRGASGTGGHECHPHRELPACGHTLAWAICSTCTNCLSGRARLCLSTLS